MFILTSVVNPLRWFTAFQIKFVISPIILKFGSSIKGHSEQLSLSFSIFGLEIFFLVTKKYDFWNNFTGVTWKLEPRGFFPCIHKDPNLQRNRKHFQISVSIFITIFKTDFSKFSPPPKKNEVKISKSLSYWSTLSCIEWNKQHRSSFHLTSNVVPNLGKVCWKGGIEAEELRSVPVFF